MSIDELTDMMSDAASDNYKLAVQMMTECLRLIPFEMPDVAISGITLAQGYWWDGAVSKDDLENARVACWNYLVEQSDSALASTPNVSAVRAVICVLYAESSSDDVGDMIYFFVQVLRDALAEDDEKTFSDKVQNVIEGFSTNR